MAYARAAVTDAAGNVPPASTIWDSTRNKDIPRNIRFFFWMLLHDAYKVDQLTYGVVRPCLFHSIEVSLDFVHSLALATVAGRSLLSNSALGANHGKGPFMFRNAPR
ncbi:hypothetical protein B0H13DRAFT_1950853 [Mycena leptocephala]|nr:hypothetical protein B0H13DRAFT_1950853 [Mycena leptocephala]